jgi:hypothetical protein
MTDNRGWTLERPQVLTGTKLNASHKFREKNLIARSEQEANETADARLGHQR